MAAAATVRTLHEADTAPDIMKGGTELVAGHPRAMASAVESNFGVLRTGRVRLVYGTAVERGRHSQMLVNSEPDEKQGLGCF